MQMTNRITCISGPQSHSPSPRAQSSPCHIDKPPLTPPGKRIPPSMLPENW